MSDRDDEGRTVPYPGGITQTAEGPVTSWALTVDCDGCGETWSVSPPPRRPWRCVFCEGLLPRGNP